MTVRDDRGDWISLVTMRALQPGELETAHSQLLIESQYVSAVYGVKSTVMRLHDPYFGAMSALVYTHGGKHFLDVLVRTSPVQITSLAMVDGNISEIAAVVASLQVPGHPVNVNRPLTERL